jgi:O-antigen ligase
LLKPKHIAAIVFVFVAMVGIAFMNMEKIEARLETGADGRFRSRMIDIAYPIIKAHPVVGVGLNNYQWHSYDQFNFWHPVHNEFLRFAAELGIPGAIFFIGMMVVLVREAYRNVLIKDTLINAIAIGALCGIIAFIIAILIGPQYQHYRIKLYFWAVAGIIYALTEVKRIELMMKKRAGKMRRQANGHSHPEQTPVPIGRSPEGRSLRPPYSTNGNGSYK